MNAWLPIINKVLITPYLLFDNGTIAFWFGTFVLAFVCVLVGRVTTSTLVFINKKFYVEKQAEFERLNTLSLRAANAGDKESFVAINSLANDSFGKTFFMGMGLFSASLWPLPFVMHWLSLHFTGVVIHTVPWLGWTVTYVPVMLLCYIGIRIALWRGFVWYARQKYTKRLNHSTE